MKATLLGFVKSQGKKKSAPAVCPGRKRRNWIGFREDLGRLVYAGKGVSRLGFAPSLALSRLGLVGSGDGKLGFGCGVAASEFW